MDSTRDSYDTVAATYAAKLGDELDGKPLDRALPAVAAGFEVRARLVREPEPAESARRCYLLARVISARRRR
jgi:hypothetical protein